MNIEDNTFLIRDGSEKGKCALSVRNNSRVDHFKIYFRLGDYSLEDPSTFQSIENLVKYYSETTSKSKIFLSNCISKGNIRSFHDMILKILWCNYKFGQEVFATLVAQASEAFVHME